MATAPRPDRAAGDAASTGKLGAMNEIEGTVSSTDTGYDKLELHWRAWLPSGKPRAIFFIVHGLFEHLERYEVAADHLRSLGYACWAIDLRGHGRSGGRRVHVRHFDDYTHDVEAGLREARQHHPDVPIILFGHSMGGVVAIRYAIDHGDELHGLVLSSPGLEPHPDSTPPGWLAALGRGISKIAPGFLIESNLNADFVSRRAAVVSDYRADPLIGSKVSARWFTAYEAARDDAYERADSLAVPTLLLLAGADQLVDPEAARAWSHLLPKDAIRTRTWPDCYHELLNEEESLEVLDEIESWLEEHVPAAQNGGST